MNRLLIVDDEAAVLAALKRALRLQFGPALQVDACTDAVAALERASTQRYDVVLSDLRMPMIDGLALLERFAGLQPHCVRLLLTGSADFATAQRAVNEIGIFRYLTKPWNDQELALHISAALERAAAHTGSSDTVPAAPALPNPEEAERLRLEALEPGLTVVQWGPNGEVLMPALDSDV